MKMQSSNASTGSKADEESKADEGKYPIHAICDVAANGKVCNKGAEQAPSCRGRVTFTQTDANHTTIAWDLKDCGEPGLHGFHIHEFSDFSNGCLSAGPHYNPFGVEHGPQEADKDGRHVGDLGNVTMDDNGNSKSSLVDHLIVLEGPISVMGRSVMVHADPDDLGLGDNSKAHIKPPENGFVSKITGNAGARIACGEIIPA